MAEKTIHAVITGKVQGVFFRACTRDEALRHNLSGWVRNRTDGSVEVLISGDANQVERMISWLHRGSPASRVVEVLVDKRPEDPTLRSFEIRY